jgi:hypothetical protein
MVATQLMILHPSGRLIPTNMYLISAQPVPPRPPVLSHDQQFQSFANWAKKTIDDGARKFDDHCRTSSLSEAEKKQAIAMAKQTTARTGALSRETLHSRSVNPRASESERKITAAALTLVDANAEARAKITAEQKYFSQFDVGKSVKFGSASKTIEERSRNAVYDRVSSRDELTRARAGTSTGRPGAEMAEQLTTGATVGSTLTPPSGGGRTTTRQRGAGIRGGVGS